MSAKTKNYFRVDGRILKLTNLDKVLFPEVGFTKKDVLRYYQAVAATVLPHIENRLFTLKRFPEGVDAPAFYEKQCPSHRPSWVRTGQFEGVNYCLINDRATLFWAVNLAAIELHTTLARIEDIQCPTFIAFDLDPGEGADIHDCAELALLLKDLLEDMGLQSFPKTSGKKGIHVFVPLNTPVSYAITKPFAREVAEMMERRYPDRVTSRMLKKHRERKIFIDWSQNSDFKTTGTVYGLRANRTPTVSTPITWKEVAKKLLSFEQDEVIRRIEKHGDLFAPVLKLKQVLPFRAEIRRVA